jgi:hypothetical protein
MPANLPDRRKQEVQASEDSLLYVMIAVTVAGMLTAIILNIVVA